MNPDKLFDYLDGRLSAAERAALEERLISDRQLQRELGIARQIHAGTQGDSREVLLPTEVDVSARGRKMALRVGAAFIVLMGVNVGIGLWLIARHETKNPNRALLETQMRQQITKALEHAATLTPAQFGVDEITIPTTPGRLDAVANQVVTIAGQLGGSATKGFPDKNRLSVLVDIPSNHETGFRSALASTAGGTQISPATSPGESAESSPEKKSFVVQIVEAPATPR